MTSEQDYMEMLSDAVMALLVLVIFLPIKQVLIQALAT